MKINRSAMRVFQIMDYLAETKEGATLSQIAQKLNEPKTSIYDLLVAAVHMNYIRKNNKKFYIGAQAKKVGKSYVERQELIDIVSPIMAKASKEYGVSTSFVVLEKNELNYLITFHPDDAVMVARTDSPIDFMHASAAGKVLLSHLPEQQKMKYISTLTYYKFTDKTISNEEKLLKELEEVYKQGYAVDNREYSYMLQCISVPIYKGENVVASLSFSNLNLFTKSPAENIQKLFDITHKISNLL